MLTIFGGKWKGKRIRVPRSDEVRPSAAKVRGAFFNILESLQLKRGRGNDFAGFACLDLFAGSGALGFEALSRGARSVVFVEKSREHARIIHENSVALGCAATIEIVCSPIDRGIALAETSGPYDLVFADPPYDYAALDELAAQVARAGLLAVDGIFVLEHAPATVVATPPALALHSHRLLGPAAISVFTRPATGDMLEG